VLVGRRGRRTQLGVVLPDTAPIPPWQETLVIPFLAVDIFCKERDHILLRLFVKVMHPVASIQHVRHHIRRRRVHDRARDHVRHVPMVAILADAQLRVAVELPDGCQVHVA